MFWTILIFVSAAVVIGLVGNRWLSRRHSLSETGFGIKELVGPITTLGVVLLAFILAQSLGSYGRAREDANAEARAIEEMANSAYRINDREAGHRVARDLACYARAVRFKEWPAMARGERAAEVDIWTDRIHADIESLKRAGGDDEIGRFIGYDSKRLEARFARMTESKPTNPTWLNNLMLVTIAVSVGGLALFLNISGRPVVFVGIIAVLAVVLSATLFMVEDLDRPFDGPNKLAPTELVHVQKYLETSLDGREPGITFPCDEVGARSEPDDAGIQSLRPARE